MALTPDEAADTLRDIEATGRRSGEAFGYRMSGPYFILWGLVWLVGYAGSDLLPSRAGLIWLVASLVGAIGSVAVSRTIGKNKSAQTGWRVFFLVVIVAAFVLASYTVMWPVSPMQQAAFVPLIAAGAYTAVGLWAGVRWIVAGVAIAILTLGGFFLMREHFGLYMAAVGGGGLIVAGLWMRSA